jgi:glycosyltransferase involved in cell wall biosynthesis
MQVGIDASNLRAGGGITHLVELLAAADPGRHGIDRVLVWSGRAMLDRLAARPWLEGIHVPQLDGGLISRLWWQRSALATAAAGRGVDVLFLPGGSYGGRFHPFVTMSRSLLPFQAVERRRYGLSAMHLKMLLLRAGQASTFRRADGVIFLNDYAREVVLASTGPLSGRTAVIPHGVTDTFRQPPRVQHPAGYFNHERPFRLLYVSNIEPYKHQWHVVDAVAGLRRTGVPIVLALVGHSYPIARPRLDSALAAADPDGHVIRFSGPAAHADLVRLYHDADAFVFASSCENMPNILLEAMAAGLPIACADRGPMPGVLGDAGLYFDPERPQTIAHAIKTLFGDADLRTSLAAKAYDRAAGFSWARCADETLAFLAQSGPSGTGRGRS